MVFTPFASLVSDCPVTVTIPFDVGDFATLKVAERDNNPVALAGLVIFGGVLLFLGQDV